MPDASSITETEIAEFLSSEDWREHFDPAPLAKGRKLARGRQVHEAEAERLDTGDAELRATVTDSPDGPFSVAVALWKEGDTLRFEGDCPCGGGGHCAHGAALLEYLAKGKGDRLRTALGGSPHAERMTRGQTLDLDGPEENQDAAPNVEPSGNATATATPAKPTFLLRVEKRPEGEDFFWLPEIFALALARYGEQLAPLDPSGRLAPLATLEGGKIPRDRAAESAALNCLYALDFLPGDAEPPNTLRKLPEPPVPPEQGPLWSPDKKAWPDPEYFWQRFRHEGVPALEKRGWTVEFADEVGHRPLVFRTTTWRAEIVEEGRGWFHLSAGFEVEGERFELQPILATLVTNRFLEATEGKSPDEEFMVFLPDGRGLVLPVGRFRRILTILGELSDRAFGEGPVRLGGLDAARIAEESESFEVDAPEEIQSLAEGISSFENIERGPLPVALRAELRDYQQDGYHWMQFLARHRLHGILADDMGLGKTLQCLAHLLAEIESGQSEGRPSLVVAPTSVVENWQREAAKFAPDLAVLILQGAGRARRFRELPRCDLALTSYALLHRDLEVLREQEFHLVALDEAQHIKNPESLTARAATELRARHRLCLSGTPVENHLGELWSLMHFLQPGLLGSRERFREQYRHPIERDHDEEKRAALARRVGPLILRRTKNEVARELPPKTEILHTIEMTEEQKDLYETVRSTMDKEVRRALARSGGESRIVFLDALLKLRQICCHPRLLKLGIRDIVATETGDGAETAGKTSAPSPSETGSAKFDRFLELCATLREEGHRVLVFSQFTSQLRLIEEAFGEKGYRWLVLTGETKDRQTLVERFQGGEGEFFLISLKAGGTGLTLTGADAVIHYDPWWNPAAENQATDRAYRIGQDRPVFVHKLICRDTVEERIQRMQERKGDLADGLMQGATRDLTWDQDMLEDLLGH